MRLAPALAADNGNSHWVSASVFGEAVQDAAFSSSINREVLRAERMYRAPAFSPLRENSEKPTIGGHLSVLPLVGFPATESRALGTNCYRAPPRGAFFRGDEH